MAITSERVMNRNIPNALSATRLVLSVLLFFIRPFSVLFVVFYLACGISDVLDGWIARRYHFESRLGARLDSAADLVFYVFLTVFLCGNFSALALKYLAILVAIVLLRLASILMSLRKTGTPQFVHTLANKVTGVFVFVCPLTLSTIFQDAMLIVTAALAFFSAVEEFAIHVSSGEIDPDRKSFFKYKKKSKDQEE